MCANGHDAFSRKSNFKHAYFFTIKLNKWNYCECSSINCMHNLSFDFPKWKSFSVSFLLNLHHFSILLEFYSKLSYAHIRALCFYYHFWNINFFAHFIIHTFTLHQCFLLILQIFYLLQYHVHFLQILIHLLYWHLSLCTFLYFYCIFMASMFSIASLIYCNLSC